MPPAIRRVLLSLLGLGLVLVFALVLALIGFRLAAQFRENETNLQAAPKTGRFVTAADLDLFVQEAGPAAGPVVLFISGLGAWSETWRPTMNALAAAGYRCIAIDLPPFGYSFRPRRGEGKGPPPLPGAYGSTAQAQRIIGALDALGVREVILVGHSFGGRATVEAAFSAPDRVRALALVSVALSLESADEPPGALLNFALGQTTLRNTLVASTGTNPWLTPVFLDLFTERGDALTRERVAIYQRPLTQIGTTEAYGLWLREFLTLKEKPRSKSSREYAALTMPTLVLWGDQDTVTPLAQADHLAGLLLHATRVTLHDIGHIPHLEDNDAVNRALLEFLRAHAAVDAQTATPLPGKIKPSPDTGKRTPPAR